MPGCLRPTTYAPHIATAFLAACATKVSLYVLLRFDFLVFQQNLPGHALQFSAYLMPLAILGILVGSGVAMFERNVKRLLAFSSVAQIGYIVLGASLVSMGGLTAAALHMFNHALAKGGLFLAVAGLAPVAAGLSLKDMGGMAQRAPWTFAAFVVAGLSLIGVPGTAGFVSKWLSGQRGHGARRSRHRSHWRDYPRFADGGGLRVGESSNRPASASLPPTPRYPPRCPALLGPRSGPRRWLMFISASPPACRCGWLHPPPQP